MAVGLRILDALKHQLNAFTGKEGVPIQITVTNIPKHLILEDLKKWMFNSKISLANKNKILTVNNDGTNIEIQSSDGLVNVITNESAQDMPLAITEINIDSVTNQSGIKLKNTWIVWLISRLFKQGGVIGNIPIKINSVDYNWSWSDISVNATIMQNLVNSLTNNSNSWVSDPINGFQNKNTILLEGTGLSSTTVKGALIELNTNITNLEALVNSLDTDTKFYFSNF